MPLSEHDRPYRTLSQCFRELETRNMVGPGVVVTLDEVGINGPKGMRFVPIDVAVAVTDGKIAINHAAISEILKLKPKTRGQPGAPQKVTDLEVTLLKLEVQFKRPLNRTQTAKEIERILKAKDPTIFFGESTTYKKIAKIDRARLESIWGDLPDSVRDGDEDTLISELRERLKARYPAWQVPDGFIRGQIDKIRGETDDIPRRSRSRKRSEK